MGHLLSTRPLQDLPLYILKGGCNTVTQKFNLIYSDCNKWCCWCESAGNLTICKHEGGKILKIEQIVNISAFLNPKRLGLIILQCFLQCLLFCEVCCYLWNTFWNKQIQNSMCSRDKIIWFYYRDVRARDIYLSFYPLCEDLNLYLTCASMTETSLKSQNSY